MARASRNRIRTALGQGRAAGGYNPPGRGWMNPAGGAATGLGQSHPAQRPAAGEAAGPPSPPPPPTVTPSPWTAQAANSEAGALKREQDTLAGLSSQWTLEQQRYGLEGPYADFKANPYSEAAKLQRTYDQAKLGSTNSQAAAGHLYSGHLVQRQLGNDYSFGQGRNALEMGYAQAGARNTSEKQAAENAYIEAVNNARWEALMAAMQEAPEAAAAPAPSAPAGGGGGGGGGGSYAKTKSGKKYGVGKGRPAR